MSSKWQKNGVIIYREEATEDLYHLLLPLRAHYLHTATLKPIVLLLGSESAVQGGREGGREGKREGGRERGEEREGVGRREGGRGGGYFLHQRGYEKEGRTMHACMYMST